MFFEIVCEFETDCWDSKVWACSNSSAQNSISFSRNLRDGLFSLEVLFAQFALFDC